MPDDPTHTDPDKYALVFENERVRVLEYVDHPGDGTSLHAHPDSVMYTLSSFRRRLHAADGSTRDVELQAGTAAWLPAQRHAGQNIGDTDTHVLFVELKDGSPSSPGPLSEMGPSSTDGRTTPVRVR